MVWKLPTAKFRPKMDPIETHCMPDANSLPYHTLLTVIIFWLWIGSNSLAYELIIFLAVDASFTPSTFRSSSFPSSFCSTFFSSSGPTSFLSTFYRYYPRHPSLLSPIISLAHSHPPLSSLTSPFDLLLILLLRIPPSPPMPSHLLLLLFLRRSRLLQENVSIFKC